MIIEQPTGFSLNLLRGDFAGTYNASLIAEKEEENNKGKEQRRKEISIIPASSRCRRHKSGVRNVISKFKYWG